MIVEFETSWDIDDGWQSKRSVDMRWVSSARPYLVGIMPPLEDATMITLAGSSEAHAFVVRSTYSRFVELWVQAQG